MPDVTFGAVSLQLRALAEAGLVDCRAEKTQRFYRARREALGSVGQALERMWDDALWRLKLAAELETTRRGPKPQTTRQISKTGRRLSRLASEVSEGTGTKDLRHGMKLRLRLHVHSSHFWSTSP